MPLFDRVTPCPGDAIRAARRWVGGARARKAEEKEGNMSIQGVLLFIGSAVIFLWGVGHLFPTRNVVAGFGELSSDNTKIITMEWLIEGFTLCFLGVLVALATSILGPVDAATHLVARATAAMLLILATISAFTGARTSVLPMKLCPYVKSAVALAFIVATVA